jgi:alkylation response protein AidB-like acyl-CoA dehydrogenase
MDFEYTEEQKLIKSSAREVMEKEIIPLADEYDKSQSPLDRRSVEELLLRGVRVSNVIMS